MQLNISEKDLGRGKLKTVKSTKSIPERVPTMNLTDKLGVKSGTAGSQKRNLQPKGHHRDIAKGKRSDSSKRQREAAATGMLTARSKSALKPAQEQFTMLEGIATFNNKKASFGPSHGKRSSSQPAQGEAAELTSSLMQRKEVQPHPQ